MDVSQLQYTLERAGGYGYRNVGFIRQMKRNVIFTFFTVTERKAWNMSLLKRRLTEWPNAFISMKAQSMRSKAEVLISYFDLICYNKGKKDEKFMYGRELRDVINEEIRLCGYFVIITSEKMTAAQALELYKSRDASEKLFRGDKSYLGNKSFRVHTSESVQAKIFIEFVALIIRSRFYTCLKELMQKSGKKTI